MAQFVYQTPPPPRRVHYRPPSNHALSACSNEFLTTEAGGAWAKPSAADDVFGPETPASASASGTVVRGGGGEGKRRAARIPSGPAGDLMIDFLAQCRLRKTPQQTPTRASKKRPDKKKSLPKTAANRYEYGSTEPIAAAVATTTTTATTTDDGDDDIYGASPVNRGKDPEPAAATTTINVPVAGSSSSLSQEIEEIVTKIRALVNDFEEELDE